MSSRARCNLGESSRDAIAFVDAIGLAEIDLLGDSLPIRCACGSRLLWSRHVGDAPRNVPNPAIVPQEHR